MAAVTIADKLSFLVSKRGEEEASLLAQAVDAGVDALYRDALVEGYLNGSLAREELTQAIGPEAVAEVDLRRQAIERDFEWGRTGG